MTSSLLYVPFLGLAIGEPRLKSEYAPHTQKLKKCRLT
jgi:hypothetical protein